MAKGKSTWKYNKLLTPRRNYFVGGGFRPVIQAVAPPSVDPAIAGMSQLANDPRYTMKEVSTGTNTGTMPDTTNTNTTNIGSTIAKASGLAGQAATDIGNLVRSISGKDVEAKADTIIDSANANMVSGIPVTSGFDDIMAMYHGNQYIKSVTEDDMGRKSGAAMAGESIANGLQGSMSGLALGPIGAIAGGVMGTGMSLLSNLFANRNVKKNTDRVNERLSYIRDYNDRALNNAAMNAVTSQMSQLNANYAAYGGELHTNGGYFTNGVTYINNGGSHETNPFEGVPMGVDPEGTPNLVEEGETVFNDYVFSKRLTVPKAIRNKYKLRGTKEMSFADASKEFAKESEERPNDPISQRGLQALMSELAYTQEAVKSAGDTGFFAEGGNLFGNGGLEFNNGKLTESDPLYKIYKDYLTDDAIDFNKLYAADSPWMQKRNQISELLSDREKSKAFREWYATQLNDYNKNRKGYTPYSADDITQDLFNRWTSDKKLGFGHNVMGKEDIDQFLSPRNTGERRFLLGPEKDANGTPLDAYATATPIKDYDANKAVYSYVSKKATAEGDTDYTDYYYRQLPPDSTSAVDKKNRYYYKGADGKYIEYTDADPNLYMRNNGYSAASNSLNDTGGTDYFYDPQDIVKQGKYADWLRFAPAVGFGIAGITDAFGWTNKIDYSNADAILEASRGSGTYQPVRYKPVGNYLTYKPFDRDYHINQLNAVSAATRRNIVNTSGGNRNAAMAGILAADYNQLGQIGNMARQAEEYNLAQRQQVEDFNRSTNMTNSQGFLQAATANQSALMNSREASLRGVMAAAEMREKSRALSDQSKSANLSGLFQSLGDIGYEEKNARMRDWSINHGVWGPGVEDYGRSKTVKAAKGGKIKRKKGLTF